MARDSEDTVLGEPDNDCHLMELREQEKSDARHPQFANKLEIFSYFQIPTSVYQLLPDIGREGRSEIEDIPNYVQQTVFAYGPCENKPVRLAEYSRTSIDMILVEYSTGDTVWFKICQLSSIGNDGPQRAFENEIIKRENEKESRVKKLEEKIAKDQLKRPQSQVGDWCKVSSFEGGIIAELELNDDGWYYIVKYSGQTRKFKVKSFRSV